ncbi:MAG TPA: hypothetical protein VEC60_11180 [Reyranella sp.]|nr:hypothetical protein [Reyranella sp.]
MLAKAEAAKATVVVALTEPVEPAEPVQRLMQAGPSVVRVELPTPSRSVTRVSRQEVVIRTAPPAPATATADVRRRNPRFSAARPVKPTAYPVRIELSAAAQR